jgi:hypothetical protein
MYIDTGKDGSLRVIMDVGDPPVTVELPGGNGDTFTVYQDGAVTDQDGTDMRRAYYC